MTTGYDPSDPVPGQYREYRPGMGASGGASSDLPYLIIGNRTSSGVETVDTISDLPLADDTDAAQRLGIRSEAWWQYRSIRDVDTEGRIYVGCPTESGGTAADVDIVVSGTSDQDSSAIITILGREIEVPLFNGDTAQTSATRVQTYINACEAGSLPVTAGNPALDGADYDVTVTAVGKGPRGIQIIGATSGVGIRVRAKGKTNTQTVTKDIASYTAGATEDDHTLVIADLDALARQGKFYYVVCPKNPTSATSTTDNGLGETMKKVKDLHLPLAGVDLELFACVGGTNAQAVTVGVHSSLNYWTLHLLWAENNDWTCGMIAAHVCAKVRLGCIGNPAYNPNGLALDVPKPFQKADQPTRTELVTALNNGVSPIAYSKGAMRLVRYITNRSLNAQGSSDHRAREGHIPRLQHWGWEQFGGMLDAQKQPNASADPPEGQIAPAMTDTPATYRAIHKRFIEEATSNRPFAKYPCPQFDPAERDSMVQDFVCSFAAGKFAMRHSWKSIQHNIAQISDIDETGPGY